MLKVHIIKVIFLIIKLKDMEFCIINLVCQLLKDIGKMIKNVVMVLLLMKMEIDMRRLIYNEAGDEKKFLVPNGPVHLKEKFYLCHTCSHGLMRMAIL